MLMAWLGGNVACSISTAASQTADSNRVVFARSPPAGSCLAHVLGVLQSPQLSFSHRPRPLTKRERLMRSTPERCGHRAPPYPRPVISAFLPKAKKKAPRIAPAGGRGRSKAGDT